MGDPQPALHHSSLTELRGEAGGSPRLSLPAHVPCRKRLPLGFNWGTGGVQRVPLLFGKE